MKNSFILMAGFILFSLPVFSQSYQNETNDVLEKFAADYSSSLFITKGPTEIDINDTTYSVAGAITNGYMVVAISWKEQNTPGQNAVYTFLKFDTTKMSVESFGINLFDSIASQFNLTGIINTKKEITGTVFPNPSNGQFTLVLPIKSGTYTCRLFTISGKYINQQGGDFSKGKISLNLSRLPKGNYLAKVYTQNGTYVFHLLLK